MDLAAADHLLTTTRSVRWRLDLTRAVEPELIETCIEIAVQAPNGGNNARYHFVVVTDPELRKRVADVYRACYEELREPEPDGSRIEASSDYLAEHLHEVPVLIIPCLQSRVVEATPFRMATRYGSIVPAAWSLMLALRARGLGSTFTTTHILREREVADILGIPEGITQAALLPVAYFRGSDFAPGPRVPGRERTYWNAWGTKRRAGSG